VELGGIATRVSESEPIVHELAQWNSLEEASQVLWQARINK
jgi:hypothetical protein